MWRLTVGLLILPIWMVATAHSTPESVLLDWLLRAGPVGVFFGLVLWGKVRVEREVIQLQEELARERGERQALQKVVDEKYIPTMIRAVETLGQVMKRFPPPQSELEG